ncbi:arylsulfatase B-like [Babylonia areolata]|uniref:arylsulfatase B-like n=1 Tax=Babylonia areolata TaxID=304850 RepID=UPI003FD1907A
MAINTTWLLVTSALTMTCFLFRPVVAVTGKVRPNLLLIVVDDLGFSDLGVHDSNMKTPTLDKLYNEGFRLNYSYTDPVGSSSGASLLSGKFSFKMGLQDGAINKYSSAHIPLNHTILPQTLKKHGYKTHMIGKWAQGFCNLDQTPTYRGFDSFFGQYTSKTDYFTMKTEEGFLDFRDNQEVMTDPRFLNLYSTEVWSKRTIKEINRHKGVFRTEARKRKCGMMAAVDQAVYRILRALKNSGQDDNTVVFFTADNGGDVQHGSSNWPLRGSMGTVWEGGIRVPSFIWSGSSTLLPTQNHTYTGTFHMVDWYPTLVGFARANGKPTWPKRIAPLMDGRNHWRLIKRGVKKSFRSSFASLVDEADEKVAYIRLGDFKMVVDEEDFPGWYQPPFGFNATDLDEPELDYRRRPFLMYNIRKDPHESKDLSRSKVPKNVEKREKLLELYEELKAAYVAKVTDVVDSSPANHPEYNNVWSPGSC